MTKNDTPACADSTNTATDARLECGTGAPKPAHFTRRELLRLSASAVAAASASGCGLSSLGARAWAGERAPEARGAFGDYAAYDGLGLAQLVGRGEVTPVELLAAAIQRLDAVEAKLNAVPIRFDERAMDRAARLSRDDAAAGPFGGVPFLLKDLHLALAGTETTNGSRLFAGWVPEHTSLLVERYEGAGLVAFGKSASPEFGLSPNTESALHGSTHNPWKPGHTAGGSSGGAAACVAAGVLPIANASDGGGSIRIPASCCGLFGMKPSRARTPLGPLRGEGWNGLTHVHAVSRSVRDSAALLDATAGAEPGNSYRAATPRRPFLEEVGAAPGRLRIAKLPEAAMPASLHPECRRALDDAAALCEALGHEVVEAFPRLDGEALQRAINGTIPVGITNIVDARLAQLGRALREDDIEPFTHGMYEQGSRVPGTENAAARAIFYRIGVEVARFQQRGGFDAMLSPTLGTPPIELGILRLDEPENMQNISPVFSPFTFLANVTGQPAMSVPLHWTPDGLPVGTMFVGSLGDEATLYRLAGQLEEARPWKHRRPPIAA